MRTADPVVEQRDSACTASTPPTVKLLRHLATIGSTEGTGAATWTVLRSENIAAKTTRSGKYEIEREVIIYAGDALPKSEHKMKELLRQ